MTFDAGSVFLIVWIGIAIGIAIGLYRTRKSEREILKKWRSYNDSNT